jgi:hypothetical protein
VPPGSCGKSRPEFQERIFRNTGDDQYPDQDKSIIGTRTGGLDQVRNSYRSSGQKETWSDAFQKRIRIFISDSFFHRITMIFTIEFNLSSIVWNRKWITKFSN